LGRFELNPFKERFFGSELDTAFEGGGFWEDVGFWEWGGKRCGSGTGVLTNQLFGGFWLGRRDGRWKRKEVRDQFASFCLMTI
jgi:hypothetical protein